MGAHRTHIERLRAKTERRYLTFRFKEERKYTNSTCIAVANPHEGKRTDETLYHLHHQRSRYIYDLFYKREAISRGRYDVRSVLGYIVIHRLYISICEIWQRVIYTSLHRVQSHSLYSHHTVRPIHDMTDWVTKVNIVRHILVPSPNVTHSHITTDNPSWCTSIADRILPMCTL